MEEEKFSCSECDKIFGRKESLEMHNSAKHSSELKSKEEKNAKIIHKKNWKFLILILVAAVVVYVFYLIIGNSEINQTPANEINIRSHQNIALHIHSNLKILIDGEEIEIPANIGVSEGVMRPVHTHDSTGEIHIEGPYKRDFTVGDFFLVWEKTLNSNCVFDYCSEKGELKFFVNGKENNEFENYVMKDRDQIRIQYSSL